MAKTKKKVTAKKTSKQQLKVVAQVETAPAPAGAELSEVAHAPAAEPTPRGFVEEGLLRVKEALDKFELGLACLNDKSAKDFYETIKPDAERKARLKAIGGFINQAGFGLSSLRDELAIALQQEKAHATADQAPKMHFVMPDIPATAVTGAAADATVTVEQREEIVQLFSLSMAMLAEAQIPAFQFENAGRVLNFQKKLLETAKAELEIVRGQA